MPPKRAPVVGQGQLQLLSSALVCVEGTDVRRLLSPEVSKPEEEKALPPFPCAPKSCSPSTLSNPRHTNDLNHIHLHLISWPLARPAPRIDRAAAPIGEHPRLKGNCGPEACLKGKHG